MATPGGLVDKQELIDAQLDTAHLGRVVNSKDASGAPISESTNRTGGVNKTLDALEEEYEQSAADLFDQFEDTFTSQFEYKRIGNISLYVGDSLTVSEKLNAYQYPDNSDNWYAPIQGQVFPIVIPADPESVSTWVRVSDRAYPQSTKRPNAKLDVFLHRGYELTHPENTLNAFSAAKELGAYGVEFDVQLTSDGVWILMHDDNLLKTTGLNALVKDTPWSVIETLDAGTWKKPYFSGTKVPKLEDALKACVRLNLIPMIEIKTGLATPSQYADLVEITNRYFANYEALFAAADVGRLEGVRAVDPNVALLRFANGTEGAQFYADDSQRIKPCIISYFYVRITGAFVDTLHNAGFAVYSHTIESAQKVDELLDLGIDGVLSKSAWRG